MQFLRTYWKKAVLFFIILILLVISGYALKRSFSATGTDTEIEYIKKQVADGDIIFRTLKAEYDSNGIIFITDNGPVVFETAGKVVEIPLENWIRGRFVVKRLQDNEVSLTPEVKERLKKTAEGLISKENISSPELISRIYKDGANIDLSAKNVLTSKEWYIVVDN